jgi:hypothetical protein
MSAIDSFSTEHTTRPEFMTPLPIHRELKLARAMGGGKARREYVPSPHKLWSEDMPESPMMKAIIDAEFEALLEPLPAPRKLVYDSDSDIESESEDNESLSGDDILNASDLSKPKNVMISNDTFVYHDVSPSERHTMSRITAKSERITHMTNKEMLLSRNLRKSRGSKPSSNSIVDTMNSIKSGDEDDD